MALIKDGKRAKESKVIEVREKSGDIFEVLHPHYEKSFTTFFGRVKSIRHLMLFLNRETFPASKLNKTLNPKELRTYLRDKIRHVPNYWYILELAAVDKVMFERDVVKEVLKMEDLKDKPVVIYDLVKKGILTTYERNTKYNRYGKVLKVIFLNIKDGADKLGIKEDVINDNISAADYKKFKNTVKETLLQDILGRIKEPLLTGVMDNTDIEEFKKIYMS